MCCCCPPAIKALFCLWVQSGFSKGSVAGALTFFPPEPALYKFERHDKDGNVLQDEPEEVLDDPLEDGHEAYDDDDDEDYDDENHERDDLILHEQQTKQQQDGVISIQNSPEEEEENVEEQLLSPNEPPPRLEPLEVADSTASRAKQATQRQPSKKKKATNNNKKNRQAEKKETSPARQLTERSQQLRRRAKRRNARDARDARDGVTYVFLLDPRLSAPPVRGAAVEAVKVASLKKGGTHLAALVYRVPPQHVTPDTKTIIYSHGNATDIGAMYAIQAILVHSLDCHVVSYDYSGYGASGGVPMEKNTYQDISTIYNYTRQHVAVDQKESSIVLYGQSVGSGPSCYLCAQRNCNAGGLILHSPFMSGMRVLTPSRALACLDIYPNINRIVKVKCPVMVIHGVLDEEVSVSHGRAMHSAVPTHLKREPWWVPDRGHNDITEGPGKMAEYIRRLRRFLDRLDE